MVSDERRKRSIQCPRRVKNFENALSGASPNFSHGMDFGEFRLDSVKVNMTCEARDPTDQSLQSTHSCFMH
jgi:hypothetical protein